MLARQPLDLSPFLEESLKLLRRTLPESIALHFSHGADEYRVHADPTRMEQVIMNLVINARDAMLPQRGGELSIDLSRVADRDGMQCGLCGEFMEGEWVRLTVTDTGSGIAPEVLPHIFEPFFTTKEVGQGTGLGLAQVYGIVKQHEGHLEVVTHLGAGSSFVIYLPLLALHAPRASHVQSQPSFQGQGETVLVVEDHATLRAALVDILQAMNYRSLQAANGREALALLEERADEIALVLSDLVMPEMGGQALFHALEERGLALPMVILSGHPMKHELKELQAQGLAGWLLKPPDVEQLGRLLAQALGREAT